MPARVSHEQGIRLIFSGEELASLVPEYQFDPSRDSTQDVVVSVLKATAQDIERVQYLGRTMNPDAWLANADHCPSHTSEFDATADHFKVCCGRSCALLRFDPFASADAPEREGFFIAKCDTVRQSARLLCVVQMPRPADGLILELALAEPNVRFREHLAQAVQAKLDEWARPCS